MSTRQFRLRQSECTPAIAGLVISPGRPARGSAPAGSTGVPMLADAVVMVASYLTAERDLGRIAADADLGTLAPTRVGGGNLLFAAGWLAPLGHRHPAGSERRRPSAMISAVVSGQHIRADLSEPREEP
jgi:hypothetical protein